MANFNPFEDQEGQKPKNEADEICPKFRRHVSKVCQTCAWWRPIDLTDPESGVTRTKYMCSQNLQYATMHELGKAVAAVYEMTESLRAETVDRQDMLLDLVAITNGENARRALAVLIEAKTVERKERKQIGYKK